MRYISILRVLCFAILCGPATAQMRATFQFDAAFGSRGNGPGQFSDPGALALDIAGDVYVADTGNDRIQKLQPDGTFLREAGGFGWGDGQFRKPSGIAVGKGLEVYVADSRNHRIQIFSFQLLLTGIIGGQDIEASPEFGELSRVTVTNANEVFVTDLDADQLLQIDQFSRINRTYSAFAYDSGQLRKPMGIAVDGREAVYVCDRENDRVVMFDRLGGWKRALGEGVLAEPTGLCLGPDETLIVADAGYHRVVVFDTRTGKVIGLVGGPDPGGGPLSFRSPSDVALGKAGSLFVLDSGNSRIVLMKMQISKRKN